MNQIKDRFMAALNRTCSGLGLVHDNMYYVYILKGDERFYTGLTNNIARRIKEHENNHVHTTARFSDKKLIFYEAFVSKKDATRRERYLKTTKGKKALKLMLRDSIS